MLINVALIGANMANAFFSSLNTEGGRLRALAKAEAEKLATSLATVAQLLANNEIDQEEAIALIEVQKAASETVLASLEGVSRIAARRATKAALASVAGNIDDAVGVPLLGGILGT